MEAEEAIDPIPEPSAEGLVGGAAETSCHGREDSPSERLDEARVTTRLAFDDEARSAYSLGMLGDRQRWPAVVALVASLLGLTFGGLSSLDYIQHLDRQVHDVHCSYVPGLGSEASPDNACRVAMYSPFAALFRDRLWGGVPISLFALGVFVFFAAFALYLLLAGRYAPRRALDFFAVFAATPLVVSLVMLTISALKLGHFCKTCVGIYVSSALLAAAGIAAWVGERRQPRAPPLDPNRNVPTTLIDDPAARTVAQPPLFRAEGSLWLLPAWAVALALFASTPALIYVAVLPSYSNVVAGCGKLEKAPEPNGPQLHLHSSSSVQPAVLFVDPLCPTCKAFHQRLVTENLWDKLDTTLVLFPLDSECNWMLDRPVHPGSCAVSKAILCNETRALATLEWAYDKQEELLAAAKAGAGIVNVRAMIKERWPGLDACIDSKATSQRLDGMLRYIVKNHLPVSTPQLFVGGTRLCDEDSDMGLSFSIRRLAPALRGK